MPSKAAAKKTAETPILDVAPVENKKAKSTKAATPEAPVKKDTKSRTKKDTTSVETKPSVEEQNVVVTVDSTETSITDNFSEFIQKFQTMLSQFSSLKTELRNLGMDKGVYVGSKWTNQLKAPELYWDLCKNKDMVKGKRP